MTFMGQVPDDFRWDYSIFWVHRSCWMENTSSFSNRARFIYKKLLHRILEFHCKYAVDQKKKQKKISASLFIPYSFQFFSYSACFVIRNRQTYLRDDLHYMSLSLESLAWVLLSLPNILLLFSHDHNLCHQNCLHLIPYKMILSSLIQSFHRCKKSMIIHTNWFV